MRIAHHHYAEFEAATPLHSAGETCLLLACLHLRLGALDGNLVCTVSSGRTEKSTAWCCKDRTAAQVKPIALLVF